LLIYETGSWERILFANEMNLQTVITLATNLANPFAFLFLYFLIALSLTAGPSPGDYKAIAQGIVEYPHLYMGAVFGVLIVFLLFRAMGFDLLAPIFWISTLSFPLVLLGLLLGALLAGSMKLARQFYLLDHLLSLAAAAVGYWAGMQYTGMPVLAFLAMVLAAAIVAGILYALPKGEGIGHAHR